MFQQILRALSHVRDHLFLGPFREPQVAPRVVHGRREISLRIEERSVNVDEYCVLLI